MKVLIQFSGDCVNVVGSISQARTTLASARIPAPTMEEPSLALTLSCRPLSQNNEQLPQLASPNNELSPIVRETETQNTSSDETESVGGF